MPLNRALVFRVLSLLALWACGLCLLPAAALASQVPATHAQMVGGGLLRMLLPILFIGILIYIMVRFFQRSGMGGKRYGGHDLGADRDQKTKDGGDMLSRHSRPEDPENMKDAYARARASWDWLSRGGTQGKDVEAGPAVPVPDTPVGFDVQEFLAGAKAAYVRIRQALAEGESEEALHFAEQSALDQIKAMAHGAELPSEFLLVNARITDTASLDGATTVSVYYDSMAREAAAEEAVQLREVWRFRRNDADTSSLWKLVSAEPMEQDAPTD